MTETAALKAAREQRERSEKVAQEAGMRYRATRWPSKYQRPPYQAPEPMPGAPGGKEGSFRDLVKYLNKHDGGSGATIHFGKGEPY